MPKSRGLRFKLYHYRFFSDPDPFATMRGWLTRASGSCSVHPSTLAAAVLFVALVGRAEVAVFVKVFFGVVAMLFHVDPELLLRPVQFPAMKPVAEAVTCFRESECKAATGNKFYVNVAEQQAAEVGHIGGFAGVAQCADKRNKGQDPHQIFHADRDGEGEHVDFLIAEEHGASHQNGVNAA